MQVSNSQYRFSLDNRSTAVHPSQQGVARQIDRDGDGQLSTREINDYLERQHDSSCGHPHNHREEPSAEVEADRAREFGFSLAGVPNPDASGYHSFTSLIADFDKLVEANPNYIQKSVLGKTAEGRDIVAYKLSEGAQGDTSKKTGVVITGCHHAREWMTVEAPLKLAQDLLAGVDEDPAKQKRLHDAEIWIVPCVNPDGYEYSRTENNMWRKNRRPVETDQLGKPTNAVGVDLNRNYWDFNPEHEYLWRPEGDKPGVISNDFSATSDNPRSDVYRGPSGASEAETQAMVKLQIDRPNVKGCMDYHSYGNDLFYPWDYTHEAPPLLNLYQEMAPKLEKASGGWPVAQGSELYLNSGDAMDLQTVHGMLGITVEMGDSFQPRPSKIPEVTAKASGAAQAFIDSVIGYDQAGLLPKS